MKELNNILRHKQSKELIDFIKNPLNQKKMKEYFYHCLKYSYSFKDKKEIQKSLLHFYEKHPFSLDYEKIFVILNINPTDDFIKKLFLSNLSFEREKENNSFLASFNSFYSGQEFLRYVGIKEKIEGTEYKNQLFK